MISLDQHLAKCSAIYTKDSTTKDIISLYNLLRGFILLHHTFVREYKHLPEINLGEKVNVYAYDSLSNEENNRSIRALTLTVFNPVFTSSNPAYVYLTEEKKNSSDISYESSYYAATHTDPLSIDTTIIKKYLDFFDKNARLIDLYLALSNPKDDKTISIMCTSSDCQKDTILEILSEFCVKINICDTNNSQDSLYIEIYVDDKLRFNLRKSKIIVGNRSLQISAELFEYILNKINISGEYLLKVRDSMTQERGKDIINMLQDVTKEVKV